MIQDVINTKALWIAEINRLSAAHIPYFFMINFSSDHAIVLPQSELSKSGISCQIDALDSNNLIGKQYDFNASFPNYGDYQKSFEYVMEEIKMGNTYLINLCSKSRVETDLTIDEIYEYSRAKFKVKVEDRIVVFSPEPFIHIDENGLIHAYPMKGTRVLGNNEISLHDNNKEMAEHYTVVDLLRNDLGMVCECVDVENFGFIEVLKTDRGEIEQMSSHISGKVKNLYLEKPGNLLDVLLPAGSISGAPKERTLEIIQSAEQIDRGFYTGVFGFGDGRELNAAVSIRFLKKEENGDLFYYSGGGITANSRVEEEYNELCKKIYLPIF